MRKILSIILTAVLLLALGGCQQPIPTDPVDTLPLPTNPPTEPPDPTDPPASIAENVYAVSMPIVSEPLVSKDGNTIFEYFYQNMYLTMPDADVANKIIVDFLNRRSQAHAQSVNVYNSALADYDGSEDWLPYTLRFLFSTTRIDQGVLSMYGESHLFNGGQRSEKTYMSANYDMVSGDVLTLGSILYHIDTKQALCQLIIEKLGSMSDQTQLYPYYDEAVEDYFQQDEAYLESFYFTADSLCFYFAPYEIAPYSSGLITVAIPYEELTGIIGDQYFPAERQESDGKLYTPLLYEKDLEDFEQFTELTVDVGGEKFLIHTDSILHNIQIRSGVWNEEGTSFVTTAVLYASNVLNSTDAIMVEVYLPDVLPILLLSVEYRGSVYSYFINQSGKDGTIYLTEAYRQ